VIVFDETSLEDRLDEHELLERARDGDPTAYEALVRMYQGLVFRTAYLITRSEADAKDATQEAFIQMYRKLGQLQRFEAFRGWLLRVVTNEARNRMRTEARHTRISGRLHEAERAKEGPGDDLLRVERHAELWRAVMRLGESDRLVIGFRYVMDMSEADMATALGWPKGTVKSRLWRALRRLRMALETPGDPQATGFQEGVHV
jgi:RNA polymerase sigma-70 factor (ECF subfamily)